MVAAAGDMVYHLTLYNVHCINPVRFGSVVLLSNLSSVVADKSLLIRKREKAGLLADSRQSVRESGGKKKQGGSSG